MKPTMHLRFINLQKVNYSAQELRAIRYRSERSEIPSVEMVKVLQQLWVNDDMPEGEMIHALTMISSGGHAAEWRDVPAGRE